MEQNSNKLAQSDRTGSNEFYKIFKVFISLNNIFGDKNNICSLLKTEEY